ncbi:hypothetical protein [Selenomonas sp. AB3002]|uniref:hypothetical protein n=1 Tax=Selenomonas sp. AB3002 TaxID=1392502 RepID=UPI00163A7047
METGGSFLVIESCQGLKPALGYRQKGKFAGWESGSETAQFFQVQERHVSCDGQSP